MLCIVSLGKLYCLPRSLGQINSWSLPDPCQHICNNHLQLANYLDISTFLTFSQMNLFKPLIIKPNVSGLINSLCSKMRLLSIPPLIPSEILYQREITPAKTPAHHNNSEIEKLLKSELCDYPAYSSRKSKFRHCYLFPHSSSWISGCYHDS